MARTRVAVAAATVGVAAALVAYPALRAEDSQAALWALGSAGIVFLLLGMAAGIVLAVGLGLATLAAEYAVAASELGADVDTRAVVWGAGLLLVAELSFLVLETRTSVLEGGDLVARRLGTVLGLLVGSVVLGSFLLAFAALEPPGGLAVQLVGVLAAAGVLAVVTSLARR